MFSLKKKLEKIGEKLGYKYVRYGIPYRWLYRKHKRELALVKSLLADKLSVKVLECAMNYNRTRKDKYQEEGKMYAEYYTRTYTFPNGKTMDYCASKYFPKGLVQLLDNEVFIDGGGYIGDTAVSFMEQTKGKFRKIHVFEAVKEFFDLLQQSLDVINVDSNRMVAHNLGLYSSEKEVYFNNDGESSRIDSKGKTSVKLVALDKYFSEEERAEITYIKLDIEGAEQEALKGMKDTITKYKPKLAVCLYHLPDDIWKIPLYLNQLNPDYHLYIRPHVTGLEGMTVCYAIP
jgi:FkbM family methyltransferase